MNESTPKIINTEPVKLLITPIPNKINIKSTASNKCLHKHEVLSRQYKFTDGKLELPVTIKRGAFNYKSDVKFKLHNIPRLIFISQLVP